MENQVVYSFASSQTADRFLNQLKTGVIANMRVRRYKSATTILVSYDIPKDATFNSTCQQLDDLAASFDGHEVAL